VSKASWTLLAACAFFGLLGLLLLWQASATSLPILRAASKADRVIVYEGLPHQAFESELRSKELAQKSVIELDNEPFYRAAIVLKPEDEKRLRQMLGSLDTYRKFSGEKGCGGFHPDFAVEFHIGANVHRAMLCFGCAEVHVTGPNIKKHFDLGRSAELEALLKPYQKNRPKTDIWP
jgi:hypothetical protein